MLTSLSITNFKSWASIPRLRLSPITGLFGTNSSGKSSILQLLLMLKQTIESTDRAQVLEFGDVDSLTNLGSFRDVVFAHQKPGELAFSVAWKLDTELVVKAPEQPKLSLFSSQDLEFACRLSENGSEKLGVSELSYGTGNDRFIMRRRKEGGNVYDLVSEGSSVEFKRTVGRPWPLPAPLKFYGFPDQVFAYFQNAGFLPTLQLELENLFRERIFYLGPLREFPLRHYNWKGSEPADMGRRGERVVDSILARRMHGAYISTGYKRKRLTLEERIARWLKELGLIHSFSIRAIAESSNLFEVRVKKSAQSAEVLITDVGFGVSQILPVLALCYYVPEGSIVLLEQPEIHLHPSVQSGLADVFIDAMKNRKIQIILESHSEHLLRRLQLRLAEEAITPDNVALYFCEPGGMGSQLVPLDIDLFGLVRNWPKDFFGDEFSEIAKMSQAIAKRKSSGVA